MVQTQALMESFLQIRLLLPFLPLLENLSRTQTLVGSTYLVKVAGNLVPVTISFTAK